MGRLAVVLGSNASGPRRRARRRPRRTARSSCSATARSLPASAPDRPRGQHARAAGGRLRPGAGDRLGRRAERELGVGSFVCPDDFIALQLGLTTFDDAARPHARPASTAPGAARSSPPGRRAAGALRDGGVYWQAIGPRFETPAEIRLMAAHADVVGMTIASECVVAGELGLAYAAVCVVDNLANGVGDAAARPSTELEATAPANAAACATRSTRCCRSWRRERARR